MFLKGLTEMRALPGAGRRARRWAVLVLGWLTLLCQPACYGLQLGEPEVFSSVGEPLNAVVPLEGAGGAPVLGPCVVTTRQATSALDGSELGTFVSAKVGSSAGGSALRVTTRSPVSVPTLRLSLWTACVSEPAATQTVTLYLNGAGESSRPPASSPGPENRDTLNHSPEAPAAEARRLPRAPLPSAAPEAPVQVRPRKQPAVKVDAAPAVALPLKLSTVLSRPVGRPSGEPRGAAAEQAATRAESKSERALAALQDKVTALEASRRGLLAQIDHLQAARADSRMVGGGWTALVGYGAFAGALLLLAMTIVRERRRSRYAAADGGGSAAPADPVPSSGARFSLAERERDSAWGEPQRSDTDPRVQGMQEAPVPPEPWSATAAEESAGGFPPLPSGEEPGAALSSPAAAPDSMTDEPLVFERLQSMSGADQEAETQPQRRRASDAAEGAAAACEEPLPVWGEVAEEEPLESIEEQLRAWEDAIVEEESDSSDEHTRKRDDRVDVGMPEPAGGRISEWEAMPAGDLEESFEKQLQEWDDAVQELRQALYEAELHMLHGSAAEAGRILLEQVNSHDAEFVGVRPWTMLFDVHRQQGEQTAFEELAVRFRKRFNVAPPTWDAGSGTSEGMCLEEQFPHVVERITTLWPGSACLDYLSSLLIDDLNGAREGFSLDVAEEIELLRDIMRNRIGDSRVLRAQVIQTAPPGKQSQSS